MSGRRMEQRLHSSGAHDALRESLEVQAAASARGFDWPGVEGVLDKVEEEVAEIRAALAQGDLAHAQRELGDLLLITVNLARFLDADPSAQLRAATSRFSQRFEAVKEQLRQDGHVLEQCTLEQLNSVWEDVKSREAQRGAEHP